MTSSGFDQAYKSVELAYSQGRFAEALQEGQVWWPESIQSSRQSGWNTCLPHSSRSAGGSDIA